MAPLVLAVLASLRAHIGLLLTNRAPDDATLSRLMRACVVNLLGEAMPTCPVCQGSDQTQSVPAVVSSQTTVGTGGGRTIGATYTPNGIIPAVGINQTFTYAATPLARMLTIPPPPRRPWDLRFPGLVLILVGAGLAVGLSTAYRGPSLSFGLFVTAAFLWLPGVVLTLWGHSRLRNYVRNRPLYEMMWRVWSSARYCVRDDVVFLPDGTYRAPALAKSMMYNSACQMLSAQSHSA